MSINFGRSLGKTLVGAQTDFNNGSNIAVPYYMTYNVASLNPLGIA